MSISAELDLLKAVTEAARKIDVLAFDTERYNPALSDHLREIYRELDDATDKFVWGRPMRAAFKETLVALPSIPERPLDEVNER